jgi:hypothetical protein
MNEHLKAPGEVDIARPFVVRINLRPNEESAVINESIGIKFSNYKSVVIVCDKRIPIIREGMERQSKQDQEAEIGYLTLKTRRGERIFIGDASEMMIETVSPLHSYADPSIKVHSVKPIDVEYSRLGTFELKSLLAKNLKPKN